jgi:hypothetical protein
MLQAEEWEEDSRNRGWQGTLKGREGSLQRWRWGRHLCWKTLPLAAMELTCLCLRKEDLLNKSHQRPL